MSMSERRQNTGIMRQCSQHDEYMEYLVRREKIIVFSRLETLRNTIRTENRTSAGFFSLDRGIYILKQGASDVQNA
jgi:hypothetical protein